MFPKSIGLASLSALGMALLLTSPDAMAWKLKFGEAQAAEVVTAGSRRVPSADRGPLSSLLEKFGTPIHEDFTLRALDCKTDAECEWMAKRGITKETLLRGVRWPDNPAFTARGAVASHCRTGPNQAPNVLRPGGKSDSVPAEDTIWCWGTTVALAPVAAMLASRSGGMHRIPTFALPTRSHFGDLQFLHSMAPRNQPARNTEALVQAWAEFSYRVALGEYPPTESVPDIINATPSMGALKGYFERKTKVAELFDHSEDEPENMRGVALGALLHMVQDSFAGCHTDRAGDGGDIKQFLTYQGQRSGRHSDHDVPQSAEAAAKPIEYSRKILLLFRDNQGAEELMKLLRSEVFRVAANARSADPGPSHCR